MFNKEFCEVEGRYKRRVNLRPNQLRNTKPRERKRLYGLIYRYPDQWK